MTIKLLTKLKSNSLIFILFFILFLSGCDFSNDTLTSSFVYDSGDLEVYFCPSDNCELALLNFIASAQQSVHCAFFELDLQSVQQEILEKSKKIDVRIVVDDQYLDEFDYPFVKADKSGLMHNKFCIIDGKKISTGSMNPTDNCAHKNNNNLILINSTVLAQNYDAEFSELWNGTFKKGDLVLNSNVDLNGVRVKNYFCPDDSCAEHVKEELKKAQESIYFMTFSFTHQGIANILLLKSLENITIRGVMEARQVSKYSVFDLLEYQGIDVVKDLNKNNMHHKVFIIDNETVITGSFNPTAGGDTKNDENLLIIKDRKIARLFLDEWMRVRG